MVVTSKTRFQVEAAIEGAGTVKHFVKAWDHDQAERRIRSVYQGRQVAGVVVMSPDEVRAHQEAELDAIRAEKEAAEQAKQEAAA